MYSTVRSLLVCTFATCWRAHQHLLGISQLFSCQACLKLKLMHFHDIVQFHVYVLIGLLTELMQRVNLAVRASSI